MTPSDLASRIDHAVLDPLVSSETAVSEVARCVRFHVRGICVFPRDAAAVAEAAEGTGVSVVVVAGFPAAASREDVIRTEVERAVADGAGEIDLVLPMGRIRPGRERDLRSWAGETVSAARGRPVKGIVECSRLDEGRLAAIVENILIPCGFAFLKTGTGVYGTALDPQRVRGVRDLLGTRLRLKVSGGIRDASSAWAVLGAGADLLGCSRTFSILAERG